MSEQHRAAAGGLDRDVVLVLASRFLLSASYSGVVAVLYNLFLARLGFAPGTIGLINGIGILSYCLLSFPAGLLVRRWGIRRSMISGSLAVLVYLAMISLAVEVPAAIRLPWLCSAGLIGGAGYAPVLAGIPPTLMRAEPRRRASVFAANLAAMFIGTALGNLVAGLVLRLLQEATGAAPNDPLPYRTGLVVALGLEALSVVPVLLMSRGGSNPVSHATGAGPLEGDRAPRRLLATIATVGTLAAVYGSGVMAFITLHYDLDFRVPTSTIGTVMAVTRALSLLPLLAAPFLSRKLGALRLALLSGAASGACGVLIALSPSWFGVAAGYLAMSLAVNAAGGTLDLLYQEAAGVRWRTVVGGTVNGAAGLGWAAVALGGGFVMDAFGFPRLVLLTLGAQAASLAVLWLAFGQSTSGSDPGRRGGSGAEGLRGVPSGSDEEHEE